MALELRTPIGPGFFIFFQDSRKAELEGGFRDYDKPLSERILRDDNEILELITMIVSCDAIF